MQFVLDQRDLARLNVAAKHECVSAYDLNFHAGLSLPYDASASLEKLRAEGLMEFTGEFRSYGSNQAPEYTVTEAGGKLVAELRAELSCSYGERIERKR